MRYYKAQQGGSFPVFRGSKGYQRGAGLGDFLRNIFRTIFPVALKGITSFLGNTSQSHDSGATWKEAAKSAIRPALGDTARAWMNRRKHEQPQAQERVYTPAWYGKRHQQPEEEQRLQNQIEQQHLIENPQAIEYNPQSGSGNKRRKIARKVHGSKKGKNGGGTVYKGSKSHKKASLNRRKRSSGKKKSASNKHKTVHLTPENYNF